MSHQTEQPRPWYRKKRYIFPTVAAAVIVAASVGSAVGGSDTAGHGRVDPSSAAAPPASLIPPETITPTVSPTPSPPPNLNEGDNVQMVRVTKVTDGDTAHFRAEAPGDVLQSTVDVTGRFLEIDTPETVKPNTPVQCFGPEASANTKHLLSVGSRVWIGLDKEVRDKFGRYLFYIWLEDGTFLNQKLVQDGYAKAVLFRPNDKYWTLMQAAQASAKAGNKGLWKACAPKPTPKPTTKPTVAPPPPSSTDPQFPTCKAAKAAGFGPYVRGQDPEYNWYRDADGDGIVCE